MRDSRISTRLSFSQNTWQKIYKYLLSIDTKNQSLEINEKLSFPIKKRFRQYVIVTSAGASNRIEGNILEDKDVESIYKKDDKTELKNHDEEEVLGYIKVLEFIFDNFHEIDISESNILYLHQKMLSFSSNDSYHRGKYKTSSNIVEIRGSEGQKIGNLFYPTEPFLVKKEMQELIEWFLWAKKENNFHPLLIITNFIFEFLAIHPFQDGNGRLSRLLTNLLLLRCKYNFVFVSSHENIVEKNKNDYYLSLNRTQRSWKSASENLEPWLFFFLKVIELQVNDSFDKILNRNLESLLSEKQLIVWSWIKGLQKEFFSRKDVAQVTGFPFRTVESILQKLVKIGLIKRSGEGRASRYNKIS